MPQRLRAGLESTISRFGILPVGPTGKASTMRTLPGCGACLRYLLPSFLPVSSIHTLPEALRRLV